MIKNYIKIAFRNLWKKKTFSAIHILGMGLAFGVAILLSLIALYEFSHDQFHERLDRIALVYEETRPQSGRELSDHQPHPLGPVLKAELPLIDRMSRVRNGRLMLRKGDKELTAQPKFVDPDFLKMFSFPLAGGNAQALDQLDDIVISADMAERLFGREDVVGERIETKIEDQWETRTISAVLEKLPENSSLTFNALLRFELNTQFATDKNNWGNYDHQLFVQSKAAQFDTEEFAAQTKGLVSNHYKATLAELKRDGASKTDNGDYLSLKALPMAAYHLNNLRLGNGVPTMYPWLLLAFAGLILFIAISNFINLSLADSFSRSKEVGMRKTLGGSPWQISLQLTGESMLVCFIALLTGIFITSLLLPSFNAFMNYRLSMAALLTGQNLLFILFLFLAVTFFSGLLPAQIISRTNIIETLKGKFRLHTKGGLRTFLMIFQFGIAVFLVTLTLTIGKQLNYLQKKSLGYNRTEVISIPIGQFIQAEETVSRIRNELASAPEVLSVSASSTNMGRGRDGRVTEINKGFEFEGHTVNTSWQNTDYDYLKTLDIELLAGRDFSRSFSSDSTSVLINERMALQLGGVEEAIGKQLELHREGGMQVIGVVKDYHFQDLREALGPLTLHLDPAGPDLDYIFVKVRPGQLVASLEIVNETWKRVNPRAEAEASYLDENTANTYRRDKQFNNIVQGGALTALLIASMGLFAVVLLSMRQRVKEIGIRKTLGASVTSIVLLLSRNMIGLLAISIAIGAPLAWWLSGQWLQTFAYRIDQSPLIILLGGGIVAGIALITVGAQALKASKTNPVESLRDE